MKQRILSNKVHLKDFIDNSTIWRDMKSEMDIWLSDIRDQLENNDGQLSVRILDRLGGNAESVRNLMTLPEVLLDIIDQQDKLKIT